VSDHSDKGAVGGVVVTTSWDDGHVLDHTLADLLAAYDLPGTFYVAPRNVELRPQDRLGVAGTRAIAERFEIGAHTRLHLRLPTLSLADAREEIAAGKAELEDTIGRDVRSFCYPGGRYAHEHVGLVGEAGFAVARTVKRYATVAAPLLELPTTVVACRLRRDTFTMLKTYGFRLEPTVRSFWNWDLLAVELFDRVMAAGGVYHLWGHSWQVDGNADWGRLERVFAHIGRRPGVAYVNNGDLPAATARG
jgi:peptidoglycan/xylan/chitin deacetylase (PgdA/CDA1 family)